jgi:hypothetical protein
MLKGKSEKKVASDEVGIASWLGKPSEILGCRNISLLSIKHAVQNRDG